MAQCSVAVRNAKLDAMAVAIGASPVVKIRSGTKPTSTSDADSGTALATFNLGASWAGTASGGVLSVSGAPFQDTGADATGTAGHWRLYDSAGTCHIQGTVSLTGQGGEMTLASLSITLGGLVQVTSFSMTEGGA